MWILTIACAFFFQVAYSLHLLLHLYLSIPFWLYQMYTKRYFFALSRAKISTVSFTFSSLATHVPLPAYLTWNFFLLDYFSVTNAVLFNFDSTFPVIICAFGRFITLFFGFQNSAVYLCDLCACLFNFVIWAMWKVVALYFALLFSTVLFFSPFPLFFSSIDFF